jgi:hypothetical protein
VSYEVEEDLARASMFETRMSPYPEVWPFEVPFHKRDLVGAVGAQAEVGKTED